MISVGKLFGMMSGSIWSIWKTALLLLGLLLHFNIVIFEFNTLSAVENALGVVVGIW